MKRSKVFAHILIPSIILGVIGIPLFNWAHMPLIHARVPENGGWSPDVIKAEAGKPLHLHITSDDVTHGFAVAGMPMQSVDVLPGKVTEVTLTFDKPGTYTFYCTRWCGVSHWRMRGTIEVIGTSPDSPAVVTPPLYVILRLDLDAPHNSPLVPTQRPSAILGQNNQISKVPISQSPDFYRSHSPVATWQSLRANPSLSNQSDGQLWNIVAFIWRSNTTSEALADGRKLFAQNCAACHGETAQGNGVFAAELKAAGVSAAQTMAGVAGAKGMTMQGPADFTDPKRMLGASPALLQGKILRGGMGTGMPSWGPIFTNEQTWDLVAYLYSFQFEYR